MISNKGGEREVMSKPKGLQSVIQIFDVFLIVIVAFFGTRMCKDW